LVLLWALLFVFTSRGSTENREGRKDFDLRDMVDRGMYMCKGLEAGKSMEHSRISQD